MDQKNRIVLIGFRGTGKSTLGSMISARLNWNYVCTDDRIEEKEGMPIPAIIEKHGWDYFRRSEQDVIQRLKKMGNVIIDTGGGVVEFEQNMLILLGGALVVWVDADVEDILQRLRRDGNRPMLNQDTLGHDVEVNYRRRLPLYKKYSNFYVNTSRNALEKICDSIIHRLVES